SAAHFPTSEPHDRIGVSSDRSFDFFGAVFDPSSLGAIEASKAMARTYGSAGLISTIIEVIPVRHKAGRRDRPIGMALSGLPRNPGLSLAGAPQAHRAVPGGSD